jgi:hypothetical protein
MNEHPHYQEDAIVNPETHHEKSDVSIRAVLWVIVIFIVFGIVAQIALWLLYRRFARMERLRNTAPLTAMQRPADMSVPQNQPLLQPFPRKLPGGAVQTPTSDTPVTDLADMRAAEQRVLTSYGWVDPQKGVVHIPIDEAMKLTLQQGLPVQGGNVESGARTVPAAGAAPAATQKPYTADSGAHP